MQQLDTFLVLTADLESDAGDVSGGTGEVTSQLSESCLHCRANDNGDGRRRRRCGVGAGIGECKDHIGLKLTSSAARAGIRSAAKSANRSTMSRLRSRAHPSAARAAVNAP